MGKDSGWMDVGLNSMRNDAVLLLNDFSLNAPFVF